MTVLWFLAFLLALAPGGAMIWYIRRLDKYEPEPWSRMWLAFLAGCISVLPALLIESLLSFGSSGTFLGTVWSAFVVAALTEELCKGAMAYAFMWRRPEFNEVMDGVVYFGVAALGFAITENLGYVFINSDGNAAQALMTGFVRTTTAVPLHALSGMIMGYHMGMFRFARTTAERTKNLIEAFLLPILLHGVYDLAAFNQDNAVTSVTDLLRVGFGTALFYAAIVALWVVLLPRIRKAQDASPWKPQAWPTMPVAPTGCPSCGSAYPMGANYCHMCAAPVAQQQAYYNQAPGVNQ